MKKHETKREREARKRAESALTPSSRLSTTPPKELRGLKIASRLWHEIVSIHGETKASQDGSPIITTLDANNLVIYCKMAEEESHLEKELNEARKDRDKLRRQLARFKVTVENVKVYEALQSALNGAVAGVRSQSARLDAHRNAIREWSKTFYLLPSSRAGVAPEGATPDEKPLSDIENFM